MLGAVDKGANVLDADNSSMDGVIATDTNVLLYAFGYEIGMDNNILDKNDSNNNYSKAYNNFITNVSKTGTILVYTYTNINEIRTVAQKMVAIKKGKELGWTKNEAKSNWKTTFQQYKNLSEKSNQFTNDILAVLSASPYILYMEQETNQAAIDLSGELLRKYSVDSNDATIIANAMLSGINSIASHDYMFKDVCGINLYTKNTKILNDAGQVSTKPINFEETSKLYNLKNN